MSLFIFLELSEALDFDVACQLLRAILDGQLARKGTSRDKDADHLTLAANAADERVFERV